MDVAKILNWIKQTCPENQHFADCRLIPVPQDMKISLLEIVALEFHQADVKQDWNFNYVQARLICRHLLLNIHKTEAVPEEFLADQFLWIQERIKYFTTLRHKAWNQNESSDWQIEEKVFAIDQLEYLKELKDKVSLRLSESKYVKNELAYLLG